MEHGKKRQSNGQFEPVALLIRKVAGLALEHPKCRAWRLTKAWADTVGESMARHTEPSRLTNGILTIRVAAPIWMNQLMFLIPELLEKLQNAYPQEAIREIRLRPGPVRQVREEKPSSFPLPRHPRDLAQAQELTRDIADEPLRLAVQRFLLVQMSLNRERRIGQKTGDQSLRE